MSANPVIQARSRLGVASRRGDVTAIEIARRDLAAEKISAYIEQVISAAPELTAAQRDRLAALLRPVSGDAS